MHHTDTICAIATPPGKGAIAVIRLAGTEAVPIATKCLKLSGNKLLADQAGNTIHYGKFTFNDELIDEILASLFRAPHSYTGEDVVEISCHGAPYIQNLILQTLTKNGARLAEPGEFTQRAFLNGKMDLSQAEGVADLIASASESSRKVALNQMRGGFSKKIAEMRHSLLQFISLVELELDFSEEDVEFADRKKLSALILEVMQVLNALADSFRMGNAIKNGIPVAIAGKTNVGKSTLLNSLLNEEKAIVSDIAGTTRDVIEDVLHYKGMELRFIDTAGIRETLDKIETIGIQRTYETIKKADVVLLVTEPDESIQSVQKQIDALQLREEQQLVVVINKADLAKKEDLDKTILELHTLQMEGIAISAKSPYDAQHILDKILQMSELSRFDAGETLVTNLRHYEAFRKASEALLRAHEGLQTQLPTDLLAQDIREALHHLGEVTGEVTTDEILGNIFSQFCIGK